jgi:hypothetical protein
LSSEGRNPDRRKQDRRASERRAEEQPTARLAAAPSDHGFTIDEPYVQRQFIVVVPNEVLIVEPNALEGLKKKASADDRAEALLEAVEAKTGENGAALSPGLKQAIHGVMALRAEGFEIRMVAALDAAKQLSLPPGHPFHGMVYAGHPGVPKIYYPLAEFHQRVFEHKFNEAIDLVMALGASRVTVEREEGFGRNEVKDVAVAFNSSAPSGATRGGFTPKRQGSGKVANAEHLFEATFPGSDKPGMPKGMVWWSSERSWQTLARARIRHGTAEFSLTLRYENDYGVNEESRGQIEAAGLDIGGRFHPQVDTVWSLNAQFPVASKASADVEQPEAAADEAEASPPEVDA